MNFSDIYGHYDVKHRLVAMADSSRLPHALLLEGPPGTSKFMLARAFARYIHCTGPKHDGQSCGKCPSCLQHDTFNHPDTFYSFPVVKKSGRSAVSEDYMPVWRKFLADSPLMDHALWTSMLDNVNARPRIYVDEAMELIRKLNLTATSSKYRIVIMWQPDRMQEECANKMLKLVEEPFPDTLFLMVSDNPRGILPTIYSRTQRIEVLRYTGEEVKDYLLKRCGVSDNMAISVAALAEGNLLKALDLLGSGEDTDAYFTMFKDLMRKAYQRRVDSLKIWASDCASLGREHLIQFLQYCSRMLRENFIMNFHMPRLNALTPDEEAFGANFSRFVNERNVVKLVGLFDEAIADIAANANAKIVMFDVAMKICILIKK